ncbi:hypothetical protein [Aquitalea aquatica]|uniref:Uncharacterized protein n=1 Tax=Aquitalea aquatica TaxID=3044273 RepID=A0A838YAY1_9NEIS|nr:hypothetical protein [Aquitalea magnusonii]MBA4710552.1 hypothetical protein [Aquitalea magnusonii]
MNFSNLLSELAPLRYLGGLLCLLVPLCAIAGVYAIRAAREQGKNCHEQRRSALDAFDTVKLIGVVIIAALLFWLVYPG